MTSKVRTGSLRERETSTSRPVQLEQASPTIASSPHLLELVAQRVRIIGEPSRIRLLLLIEQRRASGQELCDELLLSHQSVSRHLSVMHGQGILTREREGSRAYYAISEYTALRIIHLATASTASYIEEIAELAQLA